ncbi:KinB-signaling pathway activation protein [Sutcliffiella halmapala]|uniref:KinB-signaling pathway activation protein n=1 Tax=Sutcliffiella halmapala TaxID=79882 RepID=UPI000995D8B8|nr:KinB-signaling pathway activation protein [Sutcliffiella halmapala]
MNSRNWVRLFLSTLFVGGISTVIVAFVVDWHKHSEIVASGDVMELLSVTFWYIGIGLIFSVISQMGFFAYLTLHRFGLGIFKSYWSTVQVVLIIFVLFDLVYFRYIAFANEGDSLFPYFAFPIFLLIYGLMVAFVKKAQTNRHAFIPALFFMVVVTTVEWFPVLRENEPAWLLLMLFPLLACNSYQMLILHKLNQPRGKAVTAK